MYKLDGLALSVSSPPANLGISKTRFRRMHAGLPASLLLHVHVYRSLGNTVDFEQKFLLVMVVTMVMVMMGLLIILNVLIYIYIYRYVPLMMEI